VPSPRACVVMEGNAGSLYGRLNRSSTRGFLAYVAAGGTCAAVLACFVLSAADPRAAERNDGLLRLSSRSARVWPVSRSHFCLSSPPLPCQPVSLRRVLTPRRVAAVGFLNFSRTSRSTGGWWWPPSSGSSAPRSAPSAESEAAGSSCPCSTSSSASTPSPPPRSPNVSCLPHSHTSRRTQLPMHASGDLLLADARARLVRFGLRHDHGGLGVIRVVQSPGVAPDQGGARDRL
jgi:hypothetical protein